MKIVPSDHLLASNRSHVYAVLDKYNEALNDAELAARLRPDWPKAYFRKAAALSGLSRHEDAAFAYLQCLSLDPSIKAAKSLLAKELHYVLTPAATKTQEHAGSQADQHSALNPSGSTDVPAADSCLPIPVLNVSTLEALKAALSEKLIVTGAIVPSNSQVTEEEQIKHPDISETSRSSIDAENEQVKSTSARPLGGNNLRPEDFECSLCIRLLYMPVTTPCGHTFCRQCLERCLDHSNTCPLCKTSLHVFSAERKFATTKTLENIIQALFHKEFMERKKIFDEEMAVLARAGTDKEYEIPIFVCTLAYPSVTCPLHVFEPRYRLMIRRCMESGARQFGMCASSDDDEEEFAEIGTLLEIKEVQIFIDGRSLVDTVGGKRFKVISRGTKDGYHTAKVEFVEDMPIAEENKEEVLQLMKDIYAEAHEWFNSLPGIPKSRITDYFGPFPDLDVSAIGSSQGPAWLWYLTAILPLDHKTQLTMLATTSLQERLQSIHTVLNHITHRESS